MDQSNVLWVCAQIVNSVCVCVRSLCKHSNFWRHVHLNGNSSRTFIYFLFSLSTSSIKCFLFSFLDFTHVHIFTCWHFGDEHTKAQFMGPIIPVKIWAWSTMLKLHLEICHFWPNSHFYYFLLRCACDFKVIYS